MVIRFYFSEKNEFINSVMENIVGLDNQFYKDVIICTLNAKSSLPSFGVSTV